jgi:hypothetical protein
MLGLCFTILFFYIKIIDGSSIMYYRSSLACYYIGNVVSYLIIMACPYFRIVFHISTLICMYFIVWCQCHTMKMMFHIPLLQNQVSDGPIMFPIKKPMDIYSMLQQMRIGC